jgi:hypothetical protein
MNGKKIRKTPAETCLNAIHASLHIQQNPDFMISWKPPKNGVWPGLYKKCVKSGKTQNAGM